MAKPAIFRVITLSLAVMLIHEACQRVDTGYNTICMEKYYERIEEDITSELNGEGFSYSYYYNLEYDSEVKLELSLVHNKTEAGKIEIQDRKGNTGSIDGTFGLKVDRDKENNKLIWTLRHDEDTKVISSPDFFNDIIGQHGSISQGGLIDDAGTTVLLSEYDVEKDSSEEGTEQYEWSIKLKVYGTKILKEKTIGYLN